MKLFYCGSACLTLALLAGCASTEPYTPGTVDAPYVRNKNSISMDEYLVAAREATQNALNSRVFSRYLATYQQRFGKNAVPLAQVGYCRNESMDPNIKPAIISDAICEALLNSGVIEVTMATGPDATTSVAEARALSQHPMFRQTTVQKNGTVEAPVLSFESRIIQTTTYNGSAEATGRTFNLNLVDLETGKIVWKFTKPMGFVEKRGVFGW